MKRICLLFTVFSLILTVLGTPRIHAQPTNDNICSAAPLTLDNTCNGIFNFSNVGATSEPNEPFPDCFEGGLPSVWFTFIAPATGFVDIFTDSEVGGTNRDTELALYSLTGDCSVAGNLSLIDCNQDGFGVDNNKEILPFNSRLTQVEVIPGETYYIQVSGWGAKGSTEGIEGTFCIEIATAFPPPIASANDSFVNAIFLQTGASCTNVNADNSGAGAEPLEPIPPCFSGDLSSIWYKFVGPPSGFTSIKTDRDLGGTNKDTEIAIYQQIDSSATSFANLVLIECDQDNGREIEFNAAINALATTPGDTFFVQVSGWEGTQGSFCIEVAEVFTPPNDQLCDAIDLTLGAGCAGNGLANNSGATFEPNENYPGCFAGGLQSVWYTFTAPSTGFVSIITDLAGDSSNNDTQLALYSLEDTTCEDISALQLISCSQEGITDIDLLARIDTIRLVPDAQYYIQASGSEGIEGPFCIEVLEVPPPFSSPNDSACNALALDVDGQIYTFPHINASVEVGENLLSRPEAGCIGNGGWCGDTLIQNSLWFSFIAPPSGGLTIDLCNGGGQTDFDTQLALFSVSNCSDFSTYEFLGANEDEPDCNTASLLSARCLTPGEEYYVLVDGYNGEEGTLSISLTELPVTSIDAELIGVPPTCTNSNNGSIRLNIREAAFPVSYLWSRGDTLPNIAEVGVGTYSVTITDACDSMSTASITLEAPEGLIVNAGNDTSVCAQSPIRIGGSPTASGGIPFQPERMYFIDVQDSSFAKVRLSNPSASIPIADFFVGSYFAGDFIPGAFYAIEAAKRQLVKVDTLSGTFSIVGNPQPLGDQVWVGLAWDDKNKLLYGLSVGQVGIAQLYLINPENGIATPTQSISGLGTPIWLAINNEGILYTLDIDTDRIYIIDPASGSPTLLGPVGFDASFAQDADFDPLTGELFLAGYKSGSSQTELRLVNLSTGLSTLIGLVEGTGEIGAMGISAKRFIDEYEYNWSSTNILDDSASANPFVTPQGNESYTVAALDACKITKTDSVSIISGDFKLAIEFAPGSDSTSVNLEAVAEGGATPYTYLWNTGETTPTIENVEPGVYQVEVTDDEGCSIIDSLSLLTTSIGNLKHSALVEVTTFIAYPGGPLNVQIAQTHPQTVTLGLYNFTGQLVWKSPLEMHHNNHYMIPTHSLAKGAYFLMITNETGFYRRKLILY